MRDNVEVDAVWAFDGHFATKASPDESTWRLNERDTQGFLKPIRSTATCIRAFAHVPVSGDVLLFGDRDSHSEVARPAQWMLTKDKYEGIVIPSDLFTRRNKMTRNGECRVFHRDGTGFPLHELLKRARPFVAKGKAFVQIETIHLCGCKAT
jgi:hypothetical protein